MSKYTFEQYSVDMEESDYFFIPSREQKLDLYEEAEQWDLERFEPMQEMLFEYFNTSVPLEHIRKAIFTQSDELELLLYEIYCYAETDTVVREMMMEVLCLYIGCPNWPINGDPIDIQEEFFKEYPEKLKAIGGTFHE